MIERLDLHNYGRFADAGFELSGVTVFLGANESGKSTIFDALGEALCKPAKSTRFGKRLEERYQADRSAQVKPPDRAGAVSQDAFHNLLAIDSDGIDLEVSDRSPWLENVKAELFSGGVDPNVVAARLEKLGARKRNHTHMKERDRVAGKLEDLQTRRRELMERRSAILRAHNQSEQQRGELEQSNRALAETEDRLAELEEELQQQQWIATRKRLSHLWSRVEESRRLARELRERRPLAVDESREIKALQSALDEARREADGREREQALAEKQLQERREALHHAEQARDTQSGAGRLAGELRRRLDQAEQERRTRRVVRWRPWALIVSALLLLAGIVAALLLDGSIRFTAPGAGALLGGLFVLLARSVRHQADTRHIDEAAAGIRDEWRQRYGTVLPEGDSAALRNALYEVENQSTRQEEEFQRLRQELQTAEQHRDRAQHAVVDARSAAEEAERRLREWLQARGVTAPDRYYALRQEVLDQQSRKEAADAEIHDALEEYGVGTAEELQGELSRRIEKLDASILRPEKGDAELRRLRSERDQLRKRQEQLQQRREGLIENTARAAGTVSGSMGELPGEIAGLDREIAAHERRLADLDERREAAAWAARMFQEVAQDSGAMLAELAEEIGERYGALVGGPRETSLRQIDPRSGLVQDYDGNFRPVDRLSRGTRDSFVLASRLVLAERALPEEKLLLFDEAFTSLDGERSDRALELLERFRGDREWQLIFFTMNPRFAERVRRKLSDVQVHSLSPDSGGAE